MSNLSENVGKRTSLKGIQRLFFKVQLSLIVTLALMLGIAGTLINIQYETQKRDQNLQNIAEAIANSPLVDQKIAEPNDDSISDGLNEYLDSLKLIDRSFSRKGTPYDNAVIESFFSSLKREELYRINYRSEKDFLQSLDDYITFYNTQRPHSNNNYKPPETKEQEYFSQK